MDFVNEPEDRTVAASKPFVLNCAIRLFSNITYEDIKTLSTNITWLKDDKIIELDNQFSRRRLLENGSLYVSSARKNLLDSDAGIYQCQANSKWGTLFSLSVQIRIAGKLYTEKKNFAEVGASAVHSKVGI